MNKEEPGGIFERLNEEFIYTNLCQLVSDMELGNDDIIAINGEPVKVSKFMERSRKAAFVAIQKNFRDLVQIPDSQNRVLPAKGRHGWIKTWINVKFVIEFISLADENPIPMESLSDR